MPGQWCSNGSSKKIGTMENYKDKKIVTNMFVSKIITEICRSHIAELP